MSAVNEKTDFTVQQQWLRFLERSGVKPGQLHPHQESEMKKAFFAAAGQILIMSRDELAELTDNEAVHHLESMMQEVTDYWAEQRQIYEEWLAQQNKETDN